MLGYALVFNLGYVVFWINKFLPEKRLFILKKLSPMSNVIAIIAHDISSIRPHNFFFRRVSWSAFWAFPFFQFHLGESSCECHCNCVCWCADFLLIALSPLKQSCQTAQKDEFIGEIVVSILRAVPSPFIYEEQTSWAFHFLRQCSLFVSDKSNLLANSAKRIVFTDVTRKNRVCFQFVL